MKSVLLSSAAALALSLPALAQDIDEDPAIDVIVVETTKTNLDAFVYPGMTASIDAEALDLYRPSDLDDLLRQLPGLEFPNVVDHDIDWIWGESPAFNHFRGYDWMKEPCRSCSEKTKDFGGCRCQAYMLTGDMYATDPVCAKSPEHHLVTDAVERANEQPVEAPTAQPIVFRNPKNSKRLHGRIGSS